MMDAVRRFVDHDGRTWRAIIVQTGGIVLEANSRPSTSGTLVFRPDDADRPHLEVPVSRDKWNVRQFSDAELKEQLALARELRAGKR